jgi:hypothetical protein
MKHLLFAASLMLGSLVSAAEAQTLFFERETAKDSTRIALTMDGGTVNGTKTWRPKQEAHGARGTLQGSMERPGHQRDVGLHRRGQRPVRAANLQARRR